MIRSLLIVSVLAAASAASSARPLLASELKVKTVWVPVGIGRPTTWVQVRRGPGLANGEACTARIECASGLCGAGTCADPALRVTCYPDADSDGYGATGAGTTRYDGVCPAATVQTSGDCDDAIATTHPGATDLCNGVDDNCDRIIDEGFPTKGRDCQDGVGECEQFGTFVCSDDGSTVLCDAQALLPLSSIEYCNGLDDDCDGQVDEEFIGYTESCFAGLGVCESQGAYACNSNTHTVSCTATPGTSSTEIANGEDDDCDGFVDEGLDNAATGDWPAGPAVDINCERDPSMLAALSSCENESPTDGLACLCRSDDTCPCGSYCSLGRCTYDCLVDEECPVGQRCSFSGRCEDSGATSLSVTSTAAPVIWPSDLEISNVGAERLVRISAWQGDVGSLRIAVPEQSDGSTFVALRCGAGAEVTGNECFVADLRDGETYDLYVRLYSQPTQGEVPEEVFVKVYYGGAMDHIVVRVPPLGSPGGIRPDGVIAGGERGLGGRYIGTLTLEGVRDLRTAAETAHAAVARLGALRAVEFPVAATYVYETHYAGATGELVLEDAASLFDFRLGSLCVGEGQNEPPIYGCDDIMAAANVAFDSGLIAGTIEVKLPWPFISAKAGVPQLVAVFRLHLLPAGDDEPHRTALGPDDTLAAWNVWDWSTAVRQWISELSTARRDMTYGPGDYVDDWRESLQSTYWTDEEGTDWGFDPKDDSLFACEVAPLRVEGSKNECKEFRDTHRVDATWIDINGRLWGDGGPGDCFVGGYKYPDLSSTAPLPGTDERLDEYASYPFTTGISLLSAGRCAERYLCYHPERQTPEWVLQTPEWVQSDWMPDEVTVRDARVNPEGFVDLASGFLDYYTGNIMPHPRDKIIGPFVPVLECSQQASLWEFIPYDYRVYSARRRWNTPFSPLQQTFQVATHWKTSAMLGACARELSRPPPTLDAAIDDIFLDGPKCVDLARFMPALYWTTQGTSGHGGLMKRYDLLFSLLHQWLEVHTFLSSEGHQAARLASVTGRVAEVDDATTLDLLASSWTIFYDQDLLDALDVFFTIAGQPLSTMSQEHRHMFESVFRGGTFLSAERGAADEYPAISLAGAVAEAAAAHLDLVGGYVETVFYERPSEAVLARRRVRQTLGDALRALGLSDWLYTAQVAALETAGAASSVDLDGVSSLISAHRARTAASLERIAQWGDTMAQGISAYDTAMSDVPVTFYDGATTPWQAYTGASQVMLGSAGKARQAVEEVGMAQDEADALWARFDALSVQSDERREAVLNNYGSQIGDICGADSTRTTELLSSWDEDGNGELDRPVGDCFLADGDNCQFEENLLKSRFSSDDMAFTVCLAAGLRWRYGASVFDETPAFEEILAPVIGAVDAAEQQWRDLGQQNALPEDNSAFWSYLGGAIQDSIPTVLGSLGGLFDERQSIWTSSWLPKVSTDHLVEMKAVCSRLYPKASGRALSADDVGLSPAEKPDCYQGALGELVLARHAAATTIDQSASSMHDNMDMYDIAVKNCLLQQDIEGQLNELEEAFEDAISDMRRKSSLARGWAGALGSWGLSFNSEAMNLDMATAEAAHARQIRAVVNYGIVQTCLLEATKHLVGFKTAALGVKNAMMDGAMAELRFHNMVKRLRRLVREGNAELESTEHALNSGLQTHIVWLDEAVRGASRKMRRAKHMVHLAVQAVEYDVVQGTLAHCGDAQYEEFSDCRSLIFGANRAEHLETVLTELEYRIGTARNIYGSAVGSTFENISLKHHLLALAADEAFGDKHLTTEQRLRLLITDPRFTYEDPATGTMYQRIPFSLLPESSASLANAANACRDGNGDNCVNNPFAIYADRACGERLDRATVAIIPEEALPSALNPKIPVTLTRDYTFSSRSCGGADEVVATTYRPHLNPFLDSVSGVVGGESPVTGSNSGAKHEVTARWLTQQELTADEAPSTSSQGFGGWGVYGDYALMISWDTLGNLDRFRLDLLDDVILRLDYLYFTRQ